MTARTQLMASLILLSSILAGGAGCAPSATQNVPPNTQPTVPPTVPTVSLAAPTLQPGWETHSASADQGQ